MRQSAVVCLCVATLSLVHGKFPFEDPSLPWDKRVDDLVGRLSIDEIVNISVAQYRYRASAFSYYKDSFELHI